MCRQLPMSCAPGRPTEQEFPVTGKFYLGNQLAIFCKQFITRMFHLHRHGALRAWAKTLFGFEEALCKITPCKTVLRLSCGSPA